ncbi:MAG: response regulator transcription factor [Patescibacteria group bacterium]|nr:response regulator transcription factor [Patescibacteria group bacterium]
MKLLLIEDDFILAQNLTQTLTQAGFVVDSASTQEAGLIQLEVNDYDCLVLDISLPDGNGFDLLTSLRQMKNKTPVIIMTARGQVEDRVKGLDLGADDYLSKPIDSNELIARIRAIIRRHANSALPVISVGDLTLKPTSHLAKIKDQELNLTVKEFSVLEYLALYHGQVITRSMLMEHVWGSDFDSFSNVIDVYIKNLRQKIKKYTPVQLITTIRGKGYILKEK